MLLSLQRGFSCLSGSAEARTFGSEILFTSASGFNIPLFYCFQVNGIAPNSPCQRCNKAVMGAPVQMQTVPLSSVSVPSASQLQPVSTLPPPLPPPPPPPPPPLPPPKLPPAPLLLTRGDGSKALLVGSQKFLLFLRSRLGSVDPGSPGTCSFMKAQSLTDPDSPSNHLCFQAPSLQKEGPVQITLKDLLNVKLKKTNRNLRTDKVNRGHVGKGVVVFQGKLHPAISVFPEIGRASHGAPFAACLGPS